MIFHFAFAQKELLSFPECKSIAVRRQRVTMNFFLLSFISHHEFVDVKNDVPMSHLRNQLIPQKKTKQQQSDNLPV